MHACAPVCDFHILVPGLAGRVDRAGFTPDGIKKKKVFSGLAAKRMEHSECLIWQVAAFLISPM